MSKFYADLHIHSKYSRATSKNLNLEELYLWGQLKGLHVLSTGDFTHPAWFKEITTKLEEAEPGFYKLKEVSAPYTFRIHGETKIDIPLGFMIMVHTWLYSIKLFFETLI